MGGRPAGISVLLAFAGPADPFGPSLVDGLEQPGPVLGLLAERPMDAVVLLSTPDADANARDTARVVAERYPGYAVELLALPLYEPPDTHAILQELRRVLPAIRERFPEGHYFASGMPAVEAAWVLLAASGEFPARILHTRPPRLDAEVRARVYEVNPAGSGFPVVPGHVDYAREDEFLPPDLDEVRRQLGIVGDHPELVAALERAVVAAPTDVSILIRGETGTGKELFARLVHRMSDRYRAPFISLNCGAVPHDLVESILFGHARGAFTGADRDRRGKFQEADGGTLFLDELLELPRDSQVKLLRVIEDGIVEPLGSGKYRRVDVRVVAATNRDPMEAIRSGQFRQDLYHRIGAVEIVLPPLRQRAEDIPSLSLFLLERINAQLRRPKRLTSAAIQRLQAHPWHGNVRDLRNALLRSAMFCREDVLDADDIQVKEVSPAEDPFAFLPQPYEGFELREYLEQVRRRLMDKACEMSQGNCTRAAQLLGISPQAVHKYLKSRTSGTTEV